MAFLGVSSVIAQPAATAGAYHSSVAPNRASRGVSSPSEAAPSAVLPNGFAIEFREVEDHGDGTSTWHYYVEEMEDAQDLSFWQLEIPSCFEVITATPEPWWYETSEPHTGFSGVKWETGGGFEEGEFTVTLGGPYEMGMTDVAAKGPDVAYGDVTGPICGDADFALDKAVSPASADPGDRVTYTITLENLTGDEMSELEIEDPLPENLAYVEDSVEAGEGTASFDDETDTIGWTGDLAPGETVTITFEADIDATLDPDAVIENTVYLVDEDLHVTHVLELEDDDDLDDVIVLDNGYRIEFLEVEDHGDGTSTWHYYVEEMADAQDLSFWVLEVPACFDIVSATPQPWESVYPDPNAHINGIKWETGAGFEEGEFAVTLEGPYTMGPAEVAAKGPDLAYGELPGAKCAEADLVVNKTVDSEMVQPGDLLTYTITVENAGEDEIEDLYLEDILPEGVRFVDGSLESDDDEAAYDEELGAVIWEEDLDAGDTQTIVFNVHVEEDVAAGTVIENVVVVDEWEASATVTVEEAVEPGWVLMVYLAADNNLDDEEEDVIRDVDAFNALERAAYQNPQLHIYVLWDRGPDHVPVDDGPDDQVRRYRVRPDLNPFSLADYVEGQDMWGRGEVNLGEPETLYNFITWVRTHYTDAYEALSIIGHGGGWSPTLDPALGYTDDLPYGIVWDDSSGDYLSTAELGQALFWATEENDNPLDVVFLEASMMAMVENAYEIAGSAHYLVASEAAVWARFAYDEYVAGTDETTTPQAFAEKIVNNYAASLEGYPLQMGALAIDLAGLSPIVEASDTLAEALIANLPAIRDEVYNAYSATQKFDSNWDLHIEAPDAYLDLYDFAYELTQHVPASTTDVHDAAQAVMDQWAPVLVANAYRNGHPWMAPSVTWNFDDAHGLSIYAPLDEQSWLRDYYRGSELAFAADTSWDEFIHEGWYEGEAPPAAPDGATTSSAASVDSPIPSERVDILVLEPSQSTIIFMPFMMHGWTSR
jgi:uncharacterized repeat protein (TIGR01451 family)